MDDFLNILKKAKSAELKELEKTLAKRKKTVLANLENEVSRLEKKLKHLSGTKDKQKEYKKKYTGLREESFARLHAQHEVAREFFQKAVESVLKEEANQKKWLEKGVKLAQNYEKGVFRANDSYDLLKKILPEQKVEKDKKIKSKGFIFENENVLINHTKENYFDNLFEEIKPEVFKLIK